jgi:hypothetical protein
MEADWVVVVLLLSLSDEQPTMGMRAQAVIRERIRVFMAATLAGVMPECKRFVSYWISTACETFNVLWALSKR